MRFRSCAITTTLAVTVCLAFHAEASPRIADGHVQMRIATPLQDIDRGFEVVASFPELKGRPIVTGESDRDHSNAFEAWKRMGHRRGQHPSSSPR